MVTSTAAPSAQTLIDELRQRRDFPRLGSAIKEAVDDEKRRREIYEQLENERQERGGRREFINGHVVGMDLARKRHHDVTRRLSRQVEDQVAATGDGGYVGSEMLMCRFVRNNFYPNICYWPAEVAAGFTDEMTIFPIPTFAVEVLSTSTAARDRGVKFESYEADGVIEYLIVDAEADSIEQYVLDAGAYRLHGTHTGGRLTSHAVRGLVLDVDAIFA